MTPHSDGSDAKVPGQMKIVTAKPTISEVLAEYLADEKERVAPGRSLNTKTLSSC